MDDHDLKLLREFRIDEAEPPATLQGRIEEQLWQAILAEESAKAGGRSSSRSRWSWRPSMLRPALAIGAAMSLAIGVAVVSDGGPSSVTGSPATGGITQAGGSGVLDSTANAIFGDSAAAPAPAVGSIDMTDGGHSIVEGPTHDADGALSKKAAELVQAMSRNPRELSVQVRESVRDAGIEDATDSAAYRATMQWIVDPAVPTDLRGSLLRSLGGLEGIDPPQSGADVLGRMGVVLGHIDGLTGLRRQALLDPDSGTLRELRSFTTTYIDPACPPGTFTSYAIFDDAGAPLDPASQPWVDWPLVIPACGSDPAS